MSIKLDFKKILIGGFSLLMLVSSSININASTHSHCFYHYHYARIYYHRNDEYNKSKRYIHHIRWYDEHHHHKISVYQEADYLYRRCRALKYLTRRQRNWVIDSIQDINDAVYSKKTSRSVSKPVITRSQHAKINKIRNDYNYLMANEDDRNEDIADYRKEVVDWVNFYRHDIYHESPVEENSDFDNYAQQEVEAGKDPEDWANTDIPKYIDGYFTDQYDGDHNGQAGHRLSVTNQYADYIGVGRAYSDNALYFKDGTDNGADDKPFVDNMYPASGLFPLNDAKNGEYWSYQFIENPYDNGKAVRKPRISVYDNNTGAYLPVYDDHTSSAAVYYNVNPDGLYPDHTYTINIRGRKYDSIKYKTTLFNL